MKNIIILLLFISKIFGASDTNYLIDLCKEFTSSELTIKINNIYRGNKILLGGEYKIVSIKKEYFLLENINQMNSYAYIDNKSCSAKSADETKNSHNHHKSSLKREVSIMYQHDMIKKVYDANASIHTLEYFYKSSDFPLLLTSDTLFFIDDIIKTKQQMSKTYKKAVKTKYFLEKKAFIYNGNLVKLQNNDKFDFSCEYIADYYQTIELSNLAKQYCKNEIYQSQFPIVHVVKMNEIGRRLDFTSLKAFKYDNNSPINISHSLYEHNDLIIKQKK
jgi:hypothetical protein